MADLAALRVSPRLSVHDQRYRAEGNTVTSAQFGERDASGGVPGPYLHRLRGCQFGGATAPLPHHVDHVLGLTPQEQMGGIDAGWVAAVVEHPQPLCDRAVGQLPCDAVGIPARLGSDATEEAIASHRPRTHPQPAAITPLHPTPEDDLQGFVAKGSAAATERAVPLGVRGEDEEGCAAEGAKARVAARSARLTAHPKFTPLGAEPPDCATSRGGISVPQFYHSSVVL